MNKGENSPARAAVAMPRVIVLDRDRALCENILLPNLQRAGFDVSGVITAAELYKKMLSADVDLVVLDIDLDNDDGLIVARHLRQRSHVGIVMLGARRGTQQQLTALRHGADILLSKPIDTELLAATLHNLNRRLQPAEIPKVACPDTGQGTWTVEANGWHLITPDGIRLDLSAPEQCLMSRLLADSGCVVSRHDLIRALNVNIYDFDPHRLEMLIHRLRRKAAHACRDKLPLLTVRGRGYLLACTRAFMPTR